MAAMKQKRYDRAIQLFGKHLESHQDQLAFFLRANAYEARSMPDEALSDYNAATRGARADLAEKASLRLYDICASYCHLSCTGLNLSPTQAGELGAKRREKERLMGSGDVQAMLSFSSRNCGRDVELYRRILLLSVSRSDFSSSETALLNLRLIMPSYRGELGTLGGVLETVQNISKEQFLGLQARLPELAQENSESPVFLKALRLVRAVQHAQGFLGEPVAQTGREKREDLLEEISTHRISELFAQLEAAAYSALSQVFGAGEARIHFQEAERSLKTLVQACVCHIEKPAVCASEHAIGLLYNGAQALKRLETESAKAAKAPLAADLDGLQTQLDSVVDLLTRSHAHAKAPAQLSSFQSLLDQLDRCQDNLFQVELARMYPNPYTILGVKRHDQTKDIKKAYFLLARQLHPDTVPQGTAQEEKDRIAQKFQFVAQAWDILGDDEKRAQYDQGIYGAEDIQQRRQRYYQRREQTRGKIMSARNQEQ